MVYLAGRSTFTAEEKHFSPGSAAKWRRSSAWSIWPPDCGPPSVQPAIVKAGLAAGTADHPLYRFAGFAGYGWLALVAVAVLLRRIAGFGKIAAGWLGWAGAVLALLVEITFTVYRDGVRDLTLLSKGFDVWDRVVVTNWSVVGLFLVLFVAGLGVVGWLISVVARAQKPMEGAAQ